MSRAVGFRYRRRRASDVLAKVLGTAATIFGPTISPSST